MKLKNLVKLPTVFSFSRPNPHYRNGLKAMLEKIQEIEVEVMLYKIEESIFKWAEQQQAIDKFGEITLVPHTNDVRQIAQAIKQAIEKGEVIRRNYLNVQPNNNTTSH